MDPRGAPEGCLAALTVFAVAPAGLLVAVCLSVSDKREASMSPRGLPAADAAAACLLWGGTAPEAGWLGAAAVLLLAAPGL